MSNVQTPQTIAHMRRMLTVGSVWQCVNHKMPHVSGERIITASKSTIRFDGTREDGEGLEGGYASFPKAIEFKDGEVILSADRIQWIYPAGVVHHEWIKAA